MKLLWLTLLAVHLEYITILKCNFVCNTPRCVKIAALLIAYMSLLEICRAEKHRGTNKQPSSLTTHDLRMLPVDVHPTLQPLRLPADVLFNDTKRPVQHSPKQFVKKFSTHQVPLCLGINTVSYEPRITARLRKTLSLSLSLTIAVWHGAQSDLHAMCSKVRLIPLHPLKYEWGDWVM